MHGDVINHCVPAGSEKEKEWNCNFRASVKEDSSSSLFEDVFHLNKAVGHENMPSYRFPITLLTCTLTNDAPLKML